MVSDIRPMHRLQGGVLTDTIRHSFPAFHDLSHVRQSGPDLSAQRHQTDSDYQKKRERVDSSDSHDRQSTTADW
jgi:hypothetical protein